MIAKTAHFACAIVIRHRMPIRTRKDPNTLSLLRAPTVPRERLQLFELDLVPDRKGILPTRKAYNNACLKLPVEVFVGILAESHQSEYETNGQLFYGYKVLIPDGTKISMMPTIETVEKYGEGQGHYVQSQALGFLELSTGSFENFVFENIMTSERSIVRQHMDENTVKTLYVCDAGYNGMAFIAISEENNHKVLMQLKSSALGKSFLKTKKRSAIYEIKLTQSHLMNYPDHQHYVGKTLKVRLIRTRGTSRLKSQVLITTLLDEKKYSWQELSKLYLQRYSIELAFRHLKTILRIEKIRKQNVLKIEQRLYAAIISFNIAVGIRNRIKRPKLDRPYPKRVSDGVIRCVQCSTSRVLGFKWRLAQLLYVQKASIGR